MKRIRQIAAALAVAVVLVGLARFVQAAVIPSLHLALGDFRAAFPTQQFAWLRPDFPTRQVWPGWTYGPMLHFLTLPLFLAPRWSWVGPIWAFVNLSAVVVSFVCAYRLAGVERRVAWPAIAAVVSMWLWFKPLQSCFEHGNIELVEMAITMSALVAVARGRSRGPGILLGIATMIKFAPVGFLAWLMLRKEWRAVKAGLATIGVIAVAAQVTLGWQNNGLALRSLWDRGVPQVNADTQSVTSVFLHQAGLLDYTDSYYPQRWFPTSRARVAAETGELACVLFAAAYGVILFSRRRRPLSPVEVSALFLPMILLLTSNHQYYYVFALIPLTVLFLRTVADRQWGSVVCIVTAYVLMSPPFRFTWIDQAKVFPVPFFYIINYGNAMVLGAFALWGIATFHMFGESATGATDRAAAGAFRRAVTLAVFAAVTLSVLAIWMTRGRRSAAPAVATVDAAPNVLLTSPSPLAVSPDGSRIAYISAEHVLCVREIQTTSLICWPAGRDPESLVADPSSPFFSPDGQWIGFFSRGDLRKVPARGGATQAFNGAPVGATGSWSADDYFVYASPYGIVRAKSTGAPPELVILPRPDDGGFADPVVTRDGTVVVFTILPAGGARGAGMIVAQSLVTGQRKNLLAGSQPHIDQVTGDLVFARGGQIFAVPFNPAGLEVADLAHPIVSDVQVTPTGGAIFDVSARGTLVYVPQRPEPVVRRTLVWVDQKGAVTPLPIPPSAFEAPRLSPDGKFVAVAIRDVTTDVWAFDTTTGAAMRVSVPANRNDSPVWFGDGRTVAFSSVGTPAKESAVFSSRIEDGGRVPTRMWIARPRDREDTVALSSASPDRHTVVGTVGDARRAVSSDLWILVFFFNDTATTEIYTPFSERDPVISPDGRWIAYSSDQTTKPEIYVQPFPAMNELYRVSDNGGIEPRWSRDGRELFYRGWLHGSGNLGMLSVPVAGQGRFLAGVPRPLFEEPQRPLPAGGASYDVSLDGRHFIMIRDETIAAGPQVRIVPQWFTRLPR